MSKFLTYHKDNINKIDSKILGANNLKNILNFQNKYFKLGTMNKNLTID